MCKETEAVGLGKVNHRMTECVNIFISIQLVYHNIVILEKSGTYLQT